MSEKGRGRNGMDGSLEEFGVYYEDGFGRLFKKDPSYYTGLSLCI